MSRMWDKSKAQGEPRAPASPSLPAVPAGAESGTSRPGHGRAFDLTARVIAMVSIRAAATALAMRLNRPPDYVAGMLEPEVDRLMTAGSDFAAALERAKEIVSGRIINGLV